MKKKTRWANIICDREFKPLKMIIADEEYSSEISVENSSLKTCKKAAMDVYGVKPGNILVTQVVG